MIYFEIIYIFIIIYNTSAKDIFITTNIKMGSSNCCACGTSTRFQVQQPSYVNNTLEHGGCCHGSRNYCCNCSNDSCFGMGTCLGCYRCCGGSSTSIYLPPPVPIYR